MSKKILLADDSITIQKVVELTFSDGDYEVIATNNGAKAMEEIPKVKPDIILSDIIMPEKNGYELCEWVKSHPEYRHIPVILLTGTFEPFDPDRAEKAGCDAVVTKPFESQSLIQKVEELIGRAAETSSAAETAEPDGEPLSGYDDLGGPEEFAGESESAEQEDQRGPEESTPFGGFAPPQSEPESTPFPTAEEELKPQGDIFSDEVAPGGEADDDDTATRMIPKMSMDDIERMRDEQREEPSSVDESPASTFEETPAPQPEAPTSFVDESASSPFEAAEEDSMEDDATRMMPKLSMEDIRRLQEQGETEDAAEPEEAAPFGGGPAIDDAADREDAPFDSEESSAQPPADEPEPAYGSSEGTSEEFDDSATQMIPRMAFDEGIRDQEEEPDETAPETPESIESPAFTSGAPGPSEDSGAANPFAAEADQDESYTAESARSSSFDSGESSRYESEQRAPFEEEEVAPSQTEEAPSFEDDEPAQDQSEQARSLEDDETFPYQSEQPSPYTEPEPELLPPPPLPPEEPVTREPEPEATAGTIRSEEDSAAGSLSEEQIDRIARRVVELLSDKAVREIAWEVIPETAEMIVRERIRELEGEDA